jgi:hypothetical protein
MEIRVITAPIELGRDTLVAVKGRTFKSIDELQNELKVLGEKHLAGLEDELDIEDVFDRVEIKDLDEFFADLNDADAFGVEDYSTYVYIS